MNITSYCENCQHKGIVCVDCFVVDGVPNSYVPKHEPEPSDVIPIVQDGKTIHGTLDMKTGVLTMTPIRTKADMIRAKSDEELANWLAIVSSSKPMSSPEWLEWLNRRIDS